MSVTACGCDTMTTWDAPWTTTVFGEPARAAMKSEPRSRHVPIAVTVDEPYWGRGLQTLLARTHFGESGKP